MMRFSSPDRLSSRLCFAGTACAGFFCISLIALLCTSATVFADGPGTSNKICITGMTVADDQVVLAITCPPGFDSGLELFACDAISGAVWRIEPTQVSTDYLGIVHCTVQSSGDHGVEYFVGANAELDSDLDGLTDARELYIHGTLTLKIDSDGDGYTRD